MDEYQPTNTLLPCCTYEAHHIYMERHHHIWHLSFSLLITSILLIKIYPTTGCLFLQNCHIKSLQFIGTCTWNDLTQGIRDCDLITSFNKKKLLTFLKILKDFNCSNFILILTSALGWNCPKSFSMGHTPMTANSHAYNIQHVGTYMCTLYTRHFTCSHSKLYFSHAELNLTLESKPLFLKQITISNSFSSFLFPISVQFKLHAK